MSPAPNTPGQEPSALAVESERLRAGATNAAIRVLGAAGFLALAFALWLGNGREGWRDQIPPLAAYLAVAAAIFVLRRQRAIDHVAWVLALMDVGVAYVVLHGAIASGPSPGPAVAGLGLSVFIIVVMLDGLVLSGRFLVLVALSAMAAECALLRQAGLGPWPMLTACALLLLAAAISISVGDRTRRLAREICAAEIAYRTLAETRAQYEKLERLQKDKDSLVQLIVHDMRSPVSATILSLEYLGKELKSLPDGRTLLEATEDALTASGNVSDMISQILDTAKLEEGRITLHLIRLSVRELLEATHQQVLGRARSRHIEIAIDAPADLALLADPRLFPRLLENLVSNAMRHTPQGGRILLLAARSGDEIVLSVHNNGTPILAEDREKIFDKFQQGGLESRRMAGWGLGLYFCRLVVEAHSGRIAVEEVEGWPTSFVIKLPDHQPPVS